MIKFCLAFVMILIFIYPSLKLIVWLARSVNKNFPQDIPLVFNLLFKSGTAINKTQKTNPNTGNPYANIDEIRLATISSIALAGFLGALVTKFSLFLPIIIWVIIISILVNFVDSH